MLIIEILDLLASIILRIIVNGYGKSQILLWLKLEQSHVTD